jgi:hypothetical protein
MKYKDIIQPDPQDFETPERNLWFAVIERALKDYCFFFDRLCNTGNGSLVVYERLTDKHRQSFNLQAIAELNRLRWFLFLKDSAQFNLTYLADQLYDDGEGAASSIRKAAKEQFKRHFIETELAGKFDAICAYVRDTIAIDRIESAPIESALRYKRYRIDP